jgi:serine/threonine-protein kinase
VPAQGQAARAPVKAARPPATVAVHVRPYAQRALLDGVEVARGAQRVVFELEPGRAHHLQIEHACCSPFVRDFAADEELPAELELKASLLPRPALLRVQADPGARVIVGGRVLGTAAESQQAPFPVPVPPGGDSPYEGQIEVRIEAEGRPPFATTARLRAGGELTVVAPAAEEAP